MAVSGGLVYVADSGNTRIDRFDPTNFAASFTSFGSNGSGSGQFNQTCAAWRSAGMTWSTSPSDDNDRIVTFDPTNFAASFTSFGSFRLRPRAVQRTRSAWRLSGGACGLRRRPWATTGIVELAAVPEPSSLALMAARGPGDADRLGDAVPGGVGLCHAAWASWPCAGPALAGLVVPGVPAPENRLVPNRTQTVYKKPQRGEIVKLGA